MKNVVLGIALCAVIFASCGKDAPKSNNSNVIEPSDTTTGNGTTTPPVNNTLIVPIDSSFDMISKPSASSEATRLNQSWPDADFIPTGWWAKAGSTIRIRVTITKGTKLPDIIVGTYLSQTPYSKAPMGRTIPSGTTDIVTSQEGLIYLRYEGPYDASHCKIELLSGMDPAPIFKYNKTTKQELSDMLKTYTTASHALFVGPRVIIVVNRERALTYLNSSDQNKVIEYAENIYKLEDKISGLDSSTTYNQPNVHRFLMTESLDVDYYMAAWNYGTFYNYSNPNAYQVLYVPSNMNSWGPWHENGHHHQLKSWTWGNLTEVTVNIYSLYVEAHNGITASRLKTGGTWTKTKAYLAKSNDVKDFNAISDDPLWVKLSMFWQLYLAYGENFYIKLHQKTRMELPSVTSDAQKMRYFMLSSCTLSGYDLTNFFKKWGFINLDDAYNEIAALKLPQPPVEPSTLFED